MSYDLQKTQNKKGAGSMAELMSAYSSKIQTIKKGDEVEGVVKKLTPQEILLDIGFKGDALVLEFDKKNLSNLLSLLKVGDRVKASVLAPESEEGFPVVSLRRTLNDLIYSKLEDKYKKKENVEINVVEATRGGYFVELSDGIKGFLPNSQVVSDTNLKGKKVEAKIVEFDKDKKRIIFSQKATIFVIDPTEIGKYFKKGDKVEAQVNNITNHGLYLTLLPAKDVQIEGFIHISEVSYQRIDDLFKMFKKGDRVKAQVVDIDAENRRMNLSIKRLAEGSFEDVKTKYKKESKLKAIIKDIRTRGITVEIDANATGFISSSKIPSGTTYNKGEAIEAEVVDYDDKRRLVILTPVLKAIPIGYR